MKRKLKKGLGYLALGFVALFLLRLGYGYLYPNGARDGYGEDSVYPDFEAFTLSRKNVASEKLVVSRGTAPSYDVSQKYEKIASLGASTSAFERDEKRVRTMTRSYNALIQYEQTTGLPGARMLQVAIGVPPEKFDRMVAEIRTIGSISSVRIDKTDQTNEFKELNAKRISLEKTRDALAALKGRGGSVDESINLENKILETEQQLQELGVKLGEYDQENEFCTVKYILSERGAVAGISLGHRLHVALVWTAQYYLMALALLAVGALFILIAIVLLEKLKVIPALATQRSEA